MKDTASSSRREFTRIGTNQTPEKYSRSFMFMRGSKSIGPAAR
jgi:hypothetical protein